MRTECKCHGLSGSCTLRTCWKKMPHFREVGDRLLERFNGASKVMGGNDGKTLIPVGQNIKPPDKQDLIYSDESPDFCLANRKTGSLGTRGRMCNSTAMDISGCDLLCCERGYREETVVLEENCLCRFHWCCVVQCKKCLVRKELSLCHWWTNDLRLRVVNNCFSLASGKEGKCLDFIGDVSLFPPVSHNAPECSFQIANEFQKDMRWWPKVWKVWKVNITPWNQRKM